MRRNHIYVLIIIPVFQIRDCVEVKKRICNQGDPNSRGRLKSENPTGL